MMAVRGTSRNRTVQDRFERDSPETVHAVAPAKSARLPNANELGSGTEAVCTSGTPLNATEPFSELTLAAENVPFVLNDVSFVWTIIMADVCPARRAPELPKVKVSTRADTGGPTRGRGLVGRRPGGRDEVCHGGRSRVGQPGDGDTRDVAVVEEVTEAMESGVFRYCWLSGRECRRCRLRS